jgi:diguanylate cyclase (GGDEF)-like protein
VASWAWWLQAAARAGGPWLLAAQQRREQALRRRLQAQEAERVEKLSTAARSLLSLESATRALERQIGEITDVYHVSKAAGRALHTRELFERAVEVIPRVLKVRGLRLVDGLSQPPSMWQARLQEDGQTALAGPLPLGFLEERLGRELSPARALQWADATGGAGLWRSQQLIGLLIAEGIPEPHLPILGLIADQLSLQLSRVQWYEQVEALAETDALTGVSVRRVFLERAQEELARCKRHELCCVLVLIDLDHFKQKNDTYGHLVGDVVLRDVARLLRSHLRDIDLIARYGGEELILLLVETTLEQAMVIAKRLQQLVEVHPIRAYDELLRQTISAGVVAFPAHAQTLETLIERADRALYAAKRAGRNRVVPWNKELSSV